MEEKSYVQKLQDPRWQRKRLEIMQRDDFKCQHCMADDKPLQIHHIAYNFKDPWEIENRLLISLCTDCHEAETIDIKEAFSYLINTLKNVGFTSEEIKLLAVTLEGENIIKPSPHVLDVIVRAVSDFTKDSQFKEIDLNGRMG